MGEWKEHKRDGLGVEIHQDTTTNHYYCGMWTSGKRNGYGERSKKEVGQWWAGEFVQGRRNKKEKASRAKNKQSKELAWEASQSALAMARNALSTRKKVLESIGKNYLLHFYQSTTTTDAMIEMNKMLAFVMDHTMCRINVSHLLEHVHEWKRNHDAADDPVLTKKSAVLFGQLLKQCRQMEQFHTDVDGQLTRILNRFQRTSTTSWAVSGENRSGKQFGVEM